MASLTYDQGMSTTDILLVIADIFLGLLVLFNLLSFARRP
jgi:hypothetical protein